jgi:hypothetical protein
MGVAVKSTWQLTVQQAEKGRTGPNPARLLIDRTVGPPRPAAVWRGCYGTHHQPRAWPHAGISLRQLEGRGDLAGHLDGGGRAGLAVAGAAGGVDSDQDGPAEIVDLARSWSASRCTAVVRAGSTWSASWATVYEFGDGLGVLTTDVGDGVSS